MKDVHSKEEKKCGDCPKTFSHLRYLNIHIRNEHNKTDDKDADEEMQVHPGENNVQADAPLDLSISLTSNPGDGFAFVEIKEEAMNLVKEEKPDDEQVAEAKVDVGEGLGPSDYNNPGENAESEKAGEEEESLVYCCQECGKAYSRKDVLRKHVKTKHRNNESEESLMLKCTACEKTYGRKDCLRKHFKRHHIDVAKKYETFACNQCDKTFSSRDKLTRHKIQHTASDGKPFKCEECPERFTRKDAMVRHLKRQHTSS